jgi:hypothetical protein
MLTQIERARRWRAGLKLVTSVVLSLGLIIVLVLTGPHN